MKRAKIANIHDFSTPWFCRTYQELERFSNLYVNAALKLNLFPSDYPWPIDSLHNWSRIWEYPFVWKNLSERIKFKKMIIIDYGSGLTFFPWFLASMGHAVIACDTSKIIIQRRELFQKMSRLLHIRGSVQYLVTDITQSAIKNSAADAVTNISIIEHIQDISSLIFESARILRPKGSFISTLDLTLDGLSFGDGFPLSLVRLVDLARTMSLHFDMPLMNIDKILPDALRFSNSPKQLTRNNKMRYPSILSWWRGMIKNQLLRPLVKISNNRIFIRPYDKVPMRIFSFLSRSYRLDMWTVMGIAVTKFKNP